MTPEYKILSSTENKQRERKLTVDHSDSDDTGEMICLDNVEATEFKVTPESRLVVIEKPRSLAADQFRLLRLRLRELWMVDNLKTLLLTSALPGEGKTTTALNLAISLSERGKHKVILLEGDFRKPSLTKELGLQTWPALVDCLHGEISLASAIRRVDPLDIYLIPSGDPVVNAPDLIGSEKFSKIIDELRAIADWVIIDAPPALPIPDVVALRKKADKCLWVLRSGSTPREMVDEAIRQLGREFVIGMVLNQVDGLEASYYHYYEYYDR
jgi:capsular exopolysaccharide synthesis family protein